MTATSKERIEVAERMRGPFDVCECAGHTYINGTLFGMQVCARDELTLRDGMRRLADLIDPTCHIALDDWASQQCMGPMLSCDRCQAAFPEINSPYVYCPRCGARVVSGDDC